MGWPRSPNDTGQSRGPNPGLAISRAPALCPAPAAARWMVMMVVIAAIHLGSNLQSAPTDSVDLGAPKPVLYAEGAVFKGAVTCPRS